MTTGNEDSDKDHPDATGRKPAVPGAAGEGSAAAPAVTATDGADKPRADEAGQLALAAASIQSAAAQLRESIASAAEAMAKAAGPNQPPKDQVQSGWERFWQVANSGLFFMLVGCVFLIVAAATMGVTHAAFTFVLVVLGVAILLYGTGTQGMGEFNSDASAAKYKVGIAGGAGIIALAVALGIVEKSEKMKTAFQIEKKYVRVILAPQSDGISTFYNYVPEITKFDGTTIPALRRGEIVEVFVPYFESEREIGLTLSAILYNVEPSTRNQALSPRVKKDFTINIAKGNFDVSDGSLDFPRYRPAEPERMQVNMQSTVSNQSQLSRVDEHQVVAPDRKAPDKPPPPTIAVQ